MGQFGKQAGLASALLGFFTMGAAAILLAVAGYNPERLKNEAALASLCDINPLPASSGKTISIT